MHICTKALHYGSEWYNLFVYVGVSVPLASKVSLRQIQTLSNGLYSEFVRCGEELRGTSAFEETRFLFLMRNGSYTFSISFS